MGPTTFKENRANWGGAIYTSNGEGRWSFEGPAATTTFPDDTIFIDNISEVLLFVGGVRHPFNSINTWLI